MLVRLSSETAITVKCITNGFRGDSVGPLTSLLGSELESAVKYFANV